MHRSFPQNTGSPLHLFSNVGQALTVLGIRRGSSQIALDLSRGPGIPSWVSLYFPLRLQTGTCVCWTALRETWLSAKHRGLSPQLPRQWSLQDQAGCLLGPPPLGAHSPPLFLTLGVCDGGCSFLPFISNPEQSWCL